MEYKIGDIIGHVGKDFSRAYKVELGFSCNGCDFYDEGKGFMRCVRPRGFQSCCAEDRTQGNDIIFKLLDNPTPTNNPNTPLLWVDEA